MFVLYSIQAYRFFYGGNILYKEQQKGWDFELFISLFISFKYS